MIDICEVGTCVLWHDSGGETDTAEGEAGEVYATAEEGRSVGRVLWRGVVQVQMGRGRENWREPTA